MLIPAPRDVSTYGSPRTDPPTRVSTGGRFPTGLAAAGALR